MQTTVHAFDFLASPPAVDDLPPVCVAFGDETFLSRLVLAQLRQVVLGDVESDVPFATFDGKTAQWRDVVDEISTVSLFGGSRRLAIVDQADEFVSKHRSQLEEYVDRPARGGVLILEVGSWASNTRLYKMVEKSGLQVACKLPTRKAGRRDVTDDGKLRDWISARAKSAHSLLLSAQAAGLVLELIGPELGLIDQELAKLSLYVNPGEKAKPEQIRNVVGGWRMKTTWELIDAAVDGDAAEALGQLDKLLQAGEHPLALLGQISWSLRRFALATKIYEQAERERRRMPFAAALEQAGFRKWPREALQDAERQLKQLGRQRAGALYRRLLDVDLALKGSHSQADRARLTLERLIVDLSKEMNPRKQPIAAGPTR